MSRVYRGGCIGFFEKSHKSPTEFCADIKTALKLSPKCLFLHYLYGAPGEIRTPDQVVRSQGSKAFFFNFQLVSSALIAHKAL